MGLEEIRALLEENSLLSATPALNDDELLR
jgi:hypothetical protein